MADERYTLNLTQFQVSYLQALISQTNRDKLALGSVLQQLAKIHDSFYKGGKK